MNSEQLPVRAFMPIEKPATFRRRTPSEVLPANSEGACSNDTRTVSTEGHDVRRMSSVPSLKRPERRHLPCLIINFIWLLFFTEGAFSQNIVVAGITYAVDTLQSVHPVGPGVKKYSYRLPEFVNGFGTFGKGLIVNVLEVDLNNPYAAVEVCAAHPANLYSEETVGSMFARKTAAYAPSGRKPVGIVNADFFLLSSGYTYKYELGRPCGMETENGMVIQRAMSGRELAVVFGDDRLPRAGNIGFSATADIGGGSPFPLATVNTYADAGELTLFNNMANSYPSDSAWAWSPHNPSIMVSLSRPAGGWKTNERMAFTVTATDDPVNTVIPAAAPYGGKDFNGEGAILVGNSGNFLPTVTPLEFNLSGKNNMTATNQGSYWQLTTDGSDPYISTTGLPASAGSPTAVTLTFEYQSSAAINDMEIFYGRPAADGGVSATGLTLTNTGIDAANESLWQPFTLNLMTAVTVHGWGKTGHTLRLDPGGIAGRTLLIRNININISGNGNSAGSRQFLESMTVGATVGIQMNVTLDGQPLPGNNPNICGADRYILQNGLPTQNNWNEEHPRTAVGYSQNRKKAYLITVDGRQSNVSVGVTTRQLADIFRVAGAHTALNLDGGGSTRMVVLGTLANSAIENRRVANALMAVTSAPQTGNPRLVLSPKNLKVTPGASRQILVSTCDDNGNILEYLPSGAAYSVRGNIGVVTAAGKFTAGASSAEGYIRVSYGAMKDSVQVTVRRIDGAGNTSMESVELSSGTLLPAFHPSVTSYKILFPELPASLSLTGTAEDLLATVAGNLTNATVTKGQLVCLTVTSENNSVRAYCFTVGLSSATGTADLPAGSVKVYPNPLTGNSILHIDLDRAYDRVPVKISNAAGAPVHASTEKGRYLRIPLNLPAGAYLLQISLDKQTKTSKLIINN